MGAGLIDDFIRDILCVPFCPYHFVHAILSNTILSVYHFVRYHFVLEPIDALLMEDLLPEIREFSEFYIFQQDGVPAHRARETVSLLTNETPDFINPTLRPPNNPDMNPINYKISECTQEMMYKTKVRHVEDLCKRIIQAWNDLDQRIIDSAVREWHKPFRACLHV